MIPRVGDSLAPFLIESVSPDAMRDWANILRDPNPLHLDADAVRQKGLGDKRINQGPANAAYVINMLLQAFPKAEIECLESRFVDNVFEGDHVQTFGTITDVEDVGDSWRIVCETRLEANRENTVLTGKAIVKMPK